MSNYEKDVSIDESAIDLECLRQPKLMIKYTQMEAKAERRYRNEKEKFEVVKAELYEEIANNPDEYSLPKKTESAINGAMIRTDEYKEASEGKAKARYNMEMAKSAVKSLYAKKEALENLVRLHAQQYFAGPSVPKDLSQKWQKKQKERETNTKVKF